MTSAALLLMAATLLSRLVGYLRDAYVAYAFGAGPLTDAYVAAFTLPDLLLHLAAGGAISISFVSMLTRYFAERKELEAEKAYSVIMSVLAVVSIGGVILGEIFARQFVTWWFKGFTAEQIELCTWLTRILLPQPVFFLLSGIYSAVLQTRRQFLIPALAPVVYTVFIILGGITLSSRMGIAALAVGATVGALIGPFLMNAWGVGKTGMRYSFSLDIKDPGFRQWLWMSIPLALGVSVVAADDWILRYFAAGSEGDITRLNYAKRLLQVPIGVLGQAVGLASLPFFARLYRENKMDEFRFRVNRSVSQLGAVCLLATSWLAVCALPIVQIAFQRGRFDFDDASVTAAFFFLFSFSLIFWAVQGLYARAFYATGDMLRPMVAGTLVTLISFFGYRAFFQGWGVIGLVMASNLAIVMHTAVLALMLDRQGLVKLSGLNGRELAKAAAVAAVAGTLSQMAGLATPLTYEGTQAAAWARFGLMSITWLAAAAGGLFALRSDLLVMLRRRVASA